MKRALLLIAAPLLLIAVLAPAPASAHSSDPGWSKPRVCVDATSAALRQWYVHDAIRAWNRASRGTGAPRLVLRASCPDSAIHVRTTSGDQSLAYSNFSGPYRTSVQIVLSRPMLRLARTYGTHVCYSRYVAAHELGHALGLHHNNRPRSVMSYRSQSRCGALVPHDRRSLSRLY